MAIVGGEPSPPEPLLLSAWISANAANLKPPVNNQCLYTGKDFILMAVGGPNTRSDYHVNQTEEWFYQLKGDMLLRIVENGSQFRNVHIREGEMFLLPGNIPHSPIRYKDTVGIVMERNRPKESIDQLQWYCPNKEAHGEEPVIIRREEFYCADIETQLKLVIDDWMSNEETRRCKECGETAPPY